MTFETHHHLSAGANTVVDPQLLQYWTQALGAPIRQSARHAVFALAPTPLLLELAQQTQHDYAGLPAHLCWADFSVLAMDMDSTLINIECIDELADYCGKKTAVSAITEAAMRGEITDFSDSLRRRVALLKGLPLSALQAVLDERLQLNPGAHALIEAAHSNGVQTLLVSGGFTFFSNAVQARLSLTYAHSNTLNHENGLLTGTVADPIMDAQAKSSAVQAVCAQLNVSNQRAIAMGDGSNDLAMMGIAGLSVAYHAKPTVQAQAMASIQFGGLDTVMLWLNR
jgi:phosphoserine phosphatase